jgi:hypothetical protein
MEPRAILDAVVHPGNYTTASREKHVVEASFSRAANIWRRPVHAGGSHSCLVTLAVPMDYWDRDERRIAPELPLTRLGGMVYNKRRNCPAGAAVTRRGGALRQYATETEKA